MAGRTSGLRTKGSWMMWAFWAAGVSLLLVEVKAGMEYVETGLQQNLSGILGDLPAVGMITLNMAEHSLWHWGSLQMAMQAVPMVATGLLLVTVALMLRRGAKS
ncbi:MAG TPA: hypothetical protein VMH31_04055 [Methylomirabilota bacterium]|nr:hypothetical protein [Methylomirabilota bacterium]